jgi:type II secretory pathway component PulF
MSISSGQSAVDGVKVFAQQPGPRLVQRTIGAFIKRVQQGEEIWAVLWTLGIIRRSERKVLEVASQAGNLPWVLQTLAENLDRRWEYRCKVAGAFLHPVFVLVVSLPIGYFAISLFMPLIKLLNDLS